MLIVTTILRSLYPRPITSDRRCPPIRGVVTFHDRHPHNESTVVVLDLLRNFAAWLTTQTSTVSLPWISKAGRSIRSGQIPWDIGCALSARGSSTARYRDRDRLIAIRSIASRSIALQTSIVRSYAARVSLLHPTDFPVIPVSGGRAGREKLEHGRIVSASSVFRASLSSIIVRWILILLLE